MVAKDANLLIELSFFYVHDLNEKKYYSYNKEEKKQIEFALMILLLWLQRSLLLLAFH